MPSTAVAARCFDTAAKHAESARSILDLLKQIPVKEVKTTAKDIRDLNAGKL